MTRAVLALGSNLGDRFEALRRAVDQLEDVILAVSGVYETAPWGDGDQPDFLNAVALVAGDVDAWQWLARARELEQAAGRTREMGRRYSPRPLDVDVIAVWTDAGDPVLSHDDELTLPHPRAHLRAFVLRPWLDVSPYAALPGHGLVLDLVRAEPVAADLAGVRARPDLDLNPRGG